MSVNDQALTIASETGPVEGSGDRDRQLGRRTVLLRRFLRNRAAVVGAVLLLALVSFALFGGLLATHSVTEVDFMALKQPPSAVHWFGTNEGGADVYAQVVHGLQRSLVIGVVVSTATSLIAALVGAGAAYLGGRVETAALTIIHFLLVVPSFLILALVSNSVSGDWRVLIVVLALFGWMGTARVVWTMSTSLRERGFVRAARDMGVSPMRVVTRHIVPHLGSYLILGLTLGVVSTIVAETSLSFLGFGIKAPDVSLGTMLADGTGSITSSPWLLAFPGGVLVLLTVSVTLIGDGIRDAIDPTSSVAGGAR